MRHLLVALAAALTLTTLTHATEIDDFVLTSAHHTYTFSLPSPYVSQCPTFSGVACDINFFAYGPGTIDAVAGYTLGGYFWLNGCCGRSGLDFELPGNDTYQLVGQDLGGYGTPFLTGTFQYVDDQYDNLHGTTDVRDGPYTLTITPEAPTSVTPEPTPLTLLATGAVGLAANLRRRLHPDMAQPPHPNP